jgi:DNA polymerase-3 subunit delta'
MAWKIHGHDWAVNLLRKHAAGDNLRHAYLFVGAEGVGRRTLALRFAQALNCTQPPELGDFCGVCRDCRQIQSMTYPDLSVLEPEEGHKDVLIDQVRALQHTLALAPYSASYRIALLPDFQRATDQAANALLKTLEEPPDRVILLLTADAPEGLLPTIVSRCEVIRLRPAPIESARTFLESEMGVSVADARLAAHLSSGRIGAAARMVEDPAILSRRREHIRTFLDLLSETRCERFSYAAQLTKNYLTARRKVGEVLPIWLSYWRDVFVRASGGEVPLVNIDLEEQVEEAASQVDARSARSLVMAHELALQQLDAYANAQLLVETLMLQWPYISLPLIGE